MSYHRLPAFTPPDELIGFGSGSMQATTQTPYQAMLAALQEIVLNYERTDISHVDFRVSACQIASDAIAKIAPGPATYAGVPISDACQTGAFGWHPADEA